MVSRFSFAARISAGAILLTFASACSGGGSSGSGSVPVTPTSPTTAPITSIPTAGTIDVPGQQSSGGGAGGFINNGTTPSSYAVTSNPSGQSFTLGGNTYKTPTTVSPTTSINALAIVFSTGYTVPVTQVYDGPHTVFYNAASDSTGTVAVSSLQSIYRTTASSNVAQSLNLTGLHRRLMQGHRFTTSTIDPNRLAVRISTAALNTSGRLPADIERAVGSHGQSTLSASADTLRIVTVPAGVNVSAFTKSLLAQPEVAEVTAVHRRHLLTRAATTVTDPNFNMLAQWYTYATGANYAWSYNPGTGTKLAIIDTGIDDNNTDLTSQLAFQETAVTPIDNTSTSSSCNTLAGATTVVIPNTAQDDNGHGTNVAGIAIAKQNTVGFVGTGWGAQLLAFKIFPSQNQYCNGNNIGANTADEAQAISDAIAQGADVISLSLGASSFDTVEFNAIENAISKGVTVVAAAGNNDDGSGPGTLDYPASYPGVIAVGASAIKDQYSGQDQQATGTYAGSTEYVTSYSQYGPSLAVVAPGGDAVCQGSTCNDGDLLHWIANYSSSTAYLPSDQCSTPSPATRCTALFNGTSMATPQVSATAAMLIAEAGGHRSLSPAEVLYAIESTADNINDPHQGHGRLNAYRALASLIRDTGAYSGPSTQKASTDQLVAFAYSTSGTNKPKILNATFPAGVPVNANGTFRIADVPVNVGTFGVAVWDDANGDGVIDVGDQIGTASVHCSTSTTCAIGTVTLRSAAAGYFLP